VKLLNLNIQVWSKSSLKKEISNGI